MTPKRAASEEPEKLFADQFLEKWAGRFPIPSHTDDPRILHILEKHVLEQGAKAYQEIYESDPELQNLTEQATDG